MAESPARKTGELANGWSLGPRFEPLPIGRIARAVQIQRYPDDLQVAEDLAVRFLLDLVDEPVHRLGDAGEVAAKPFTVESGRHRLVVLGADVDDARDVADAAVVVRAVHHRDELVVRVLDVLVVLAVLVAVVRLPVEEGDDERVLEPDVDRVRVFGTSPDREPGDRVAGTCCPWSRSGRLPARASPSRPPPSRPRRCAPPRSARAHRSDR